MLNTVKARRSLLSGARGEGESPRPHPCQAGRAPGEGRGNARGPGVRGSWSLEPQLGGAEIRGDIAGSRRPLAAPWQSGGQRGGRLRGLVALGQVPPSQRWGGRGGGGLGWRMLKRRPLGHRPVPSSPLSLSFSVFLFFLPHRSHSSCPSPTLCPHSLSHSPPFLASFAHPPSRPRGAAPRRAGLAVSPLDLVLLIRF